VWHVLSGYLLSECSLVYHSTHSCLTRWCLPCSRMSTYRSIEAWHAAVRYASRAGAAPDISTCSFFCDKCVILYRRHAGALFELPSPASEDGMLPYPALRQTISSAQLAPSAHMLEHYNPPGGELLARMCCVAVAICGPV